MLEELIALVGPAQRQGVGEKAAEKFAVLIDIQPQPGSILTLTAQGLEGEFMFI